MILVAKPDMLASSKLFFIAFPPHWSVVFTARTWAMCWSIGISVMQWKQASLALAPAAGGFVILNVGMERLTTSRETISQDLEASTKFLAIAWPFPGTHVLKRHVQSLYCECQKGQSGFVPPRFGAERAWAVHIFVSKVGQSLPEKNKETCTYWHDWPKCSGFWMFRASTSKQKHAIYSDLLHGRNLKGSKPRCASSSWQQMQITKKYSNAPSFIFVTLAIGTWEMPLNLAGSVNARRLGPQACACMLMSPRDSMAGCFFSLWPKPKI